VRTDNLRDNQFARQQRKTATLNRAAVLQSASADKGQVRFTDSVLRGEGQSNFSWAGTISTSGTFTNEGSFTNYGPTNLRGPVDITGSTTIQGPLDVTGTTRLAGTTTVEGDLAVTKTLDVTATTRLRGEVTLESDLVIVGNGKIRAGIVTIDGSGGGRVAAAGNLSLVAAFGSEVIVTGGFHVTNPSLFEGDVTILDDLLIAGRIEVAGINAYALPTTSQPPNLYVNGNGDIYRSTATLAPAP
jgi:cytoskeletal protein CcmA (bactofilin family)